MMEEFVQKFRRAVRESGFEERPLIEEFKQEMNRMIWRELIEAEYPPRSIKQWYKRTTNLDRLQKESKQEKEWLRDRKETENQVPRLGLNMLANAGETNRQ